MDDIKLVHTIVEEEKAVKVMSYNNVICYGHLFNYKSDSDTEDDWRFHASNDVSFDRSMLIGISKSIDLLNNKVVNKT